jgi:hypothetical protein
MKTLRHAARILVATVAAGGRVRLLNSIEQNEDLGYEDVCRRVPWLH